MEDKMFLETILKSVQWMNDNNRESFSKMTILVSKKKIIVPEEDIREFHDHIRDGDKIIDEIKSSIMALSSSGKID